MEKWERDLTAVIRRGVTKQGLLERLVEIAVVLSEGSEDREQVEFDLFTAVVGGDPAALKRLFQEAFEEDDAFDARVSVLQYLWNLALEESVKLMWTAEFLRNETDLRSYVEEMLFPDADGLNDEEDERVTAIIEALDRLIQFLKRPPEA